MRVFYSLGIVALALLITANLEGRGQMGGARGGGGGRAGGQVGGHNINRSPSMSRNTRPQNINNGNRSVTQNQLQQHLQASPYENLARSNQLGQNINRPNQGLNVTPNLRSGERPTNLPIKTNQVAQAGQNVRDRVQQDRPNYGNWFDGNFWNNHNYYPPYYGPNQVNRGWARTSALGMAAWLGWQAAPGYYYDDGYYSEPWPEYSQEPLQYQDQTQAPIDQSLDSTWMPLGVFALSKGNGSTTTPNIYLQLALGKDGSLSGTFYNSTTDQTYSAVGLVDQNSQRAAWKVVNNDNAPILETGLYNLSQDEVPVQATFADGRIQQLMLIRLQNPTSS